MFSFYCYACLCLLWRFSRRAHKPISTKIKICNSVPLGATFISKRSKGRLWLVCVDHHHINRWRQRHRHSPKRPTITVQWHVSLAVNWTQWPWQLTFYSHKYYVISLYSTYLPYLISWNRVLLGNLISSASQQTLPTYCNLKANYTIYNSPIPVPTLNHIKSGHTCPIDFPNIHYMIIPHKCKFSVYSLAFTFPHQTLYTSLLYSKIATCLSINFFWFDHPNIMYFVRSADHEALHYTDFWISLLAAPFSVQLSFTSLYI